MQEKQIRSLVWEDPLKKGRGTHSVILSGKSHGQRNLVGYSSWGHKDSENDLVIKLPPRKRKELIFFFKGRDIERESCGLQETMVRNKAQINYNRVLMLFTEI